MHTTPSYCICQIGCERKAYEYQLVFISRVLQNWRSVNSPLALPCHYTSLDSTSNTAFTVLLQYTLVFLLLVCRKPVHSIDSVGHAVGLMLHPTSVDVQHFRDFV